MRLARTNTLEVVIVLIAMSLTGVAASVSIPNTGLTTECEMRLRYWLVVQLASVTSPDPDPRHPVDWLRVSATSLDRGLSAYVPMLSADD